MDSSKSVLPPPPPPPGVAERTNLSQNHHHHPMNENNNGSFPFTSILLIAIPIIIVILLFVVSLLLVMLRRLQYSCKSYCSCKYAASSSKSSNSPNTMPANSSPDENGGCLHSVSSRRGMPLETKLKGVQVFTYKEMEIATNRFSKENVIGNGGYGVVYKGTLSNGSMAAIKVLHREGKLGERAFRLEVDLLSRLRSPHLVELIGYCADQHYRLLIFEYLPNGSLHHLLHTTCSDNRQISVGLNWGMRLRIALDCAKALEYLHEYTSPSVIHRDFKTSNILLDHDFRARVSDFGLAKIGSDKINGLVSTRVLGTTGYLAPEYASTGKLTTKSDVYSYGIVLLELLTGRVPIDTKRPSGEHVLVSWAMPRLTNREKVVEMVDPAIKDQYSKKELIQVAAIAAMCVQTEPDYRPLMTDVVQSMIPLVKNLLSTGHPLGSYRDNNQRASPTNGNRIRPSNTGQRTS